MGAYSPCRHRLYHRNGWFCEKSGRSYPLSLALSRREREFLRHFPLLQSFCECSKVVRGYFHCAIRARLRIKYALLLDVRVPLPPGMTERVAPGIPEAGPLAGFDAAAWHVCHRLAESCCWSILRYPLLVPFFRPTYIIAVLIAIAVHECAHAYAAYRLGDDTAKHAGRLTLNPLAHLDPMGALLFLVVGFGWAKPVPVNPARLGRPKRDNALVALAGPASNLLLAGIAFAGLLLLGISWGGSFDLLSLRGASVLQTFLLQLCGSLLFVNLALMAFNLFPVAPLDGSKILEGFVPYRHELEYERFMQYGPYILLGLLLFESFLPFPILSGWVFGISDAVLGVFEIFAGVLL